MSEKQELLASLMESKKNLQKDTPEAFRRQIFEELKELEELEEQKSKEALELLGQKHKLGKLKKERERARMLQGKELPVAEREFTVATGSSSFRSFSPSMAPGEEVEMSTLSRESPSLERERDWWSADLEGELEKLAVEWSFSGAASRSKHPDGKADHWSTQTVPRKEESEGVRLDWLETKDRKWKWTRSSLRYSSRAMKRKAVFIMCEVEEQQAARVEVQSPKKKGIDTCRVRRNGRLCSGKVCL